MAKKSKRRRLTAWEKLISRENRKLVRLSELLSEIEDEAAPIREQVRIQKLVVDRLKKGEAPE